MGEIHNVVDRLRTGVGMVAITRGGRIPFWLFSIESTADKPLMSKSKVAVGEL